MAPNELRLRKRDKDEAVDGQRRVPSAAADPTAPSYLSLIIAVVVAAVILRIVTPRPKLFTSDLLAKYNGEDENLRIYLSILGSVFDVSRGKEHYGKSGAYHHFSGRDATRAFVTGNFTGDGLTDNVHGLSALELKSIGDWRSFYMKSYTHVGKLIGTYYDARGKPTPELERVEKEIVHGTKLAKLKEAEEKKLPACNSRWSQKDGGEVWCSSGYPRKVSSRFSPPGTAEVRCACFSKKELKGRPGLQVYPGCDPLATICKTS